MITRNRGDICVIRMKPTTCQGLSVFRKLAYHGWALFNADRWLGRLRTNAEKPNPRLIDEWSMKYDDDNRDWQEDW